jgi:hypothetical protein
VARWSGGLPPSSSLQLLHMELARQQSDGTPMAIRITSSSNVGSPRAGTPRRGASRLSVSGAALGSGTPAKRGASSEEQQQHWQLALQQQQEEQQQQQQQQQQGGGGGRAALRASATRSLTSLQSSVSELPGPASSAYELHGRSISQLVQSNSALVLEQYYASAVVPPNGVYTMSIGDLYQVEYHREPAGKAYAESGILRDILAYSEAELAQSIELWTVAALCRSLSLDNILLLLAAALLEKQMVMFCPNIGTLSAVVLSLVPLLRPFGWQCLLLPVTPTGMLGFLEAPVPFILGVQYKTHEVVSKCHGLMRVNVYKDVVKNCAVPVLPGAKKLAAALAPHYARLRAAADAAAYRPVYSIEPEEAAAAGTCLELASEHLAAMCGDLRLYTITNVGMEKRTGFLFKDGYLDSFPQRDRPFMRAFADTQMFSVWSDAVISAFCETL